MDKQTLKQRIDVAAGRAPADLRIANCRVVDVYNKAVFPADVLISGGYIAGWGAPDFPEAREVYDAGGAYLAPGLIDSHQPSLSGGVLPAGGAPRHDHRGGGPPRDLQRLRAGRLRLHAARLGAHRAAGVPAGALLRALHPL